MYTHPEKSSGAYWHMQIHKYSYDLHVETNGKNFSWISDQFEESYHKRIF